MPIGHLCIFFWRNICRNLLAISQLGYLSLCSWVVRVLYTFCNQVLIKYMICKYSSPSLWVSFHFLDGILWSAKFLIFVKSNLSMFSYATCAFGVIFKKPLPTQDHFTPMFSSKSFIVLALTFWSVIHLEVILVYGAVAGRMFSICSISSSLDSY